MSRVVLAQCALVAGIALVTAYVWLRATGTRTFTVAGLFSCVAIFVLTALLIEALVARARRGRLRRAHARPRTSKTRKAA
ncbi:hypothetical protein ACIQVL_48715 [Streptomyces sp. NPDC090499]|uniref:hypothetical protein n=1 Tax=Streptomyces sp. NPDC090499 TaxID=3365965 RepID=UPI0037FD52E7